MYLIDIAKEFYKYRQKAALREKQDRNCRRIDSVALISMMIAFSSLENSIIIYLNFNRMYRASWP